MINMIIPKKMRSFVHVALIITLSPGDKILVHHNIKNFILAHKRCMDLGDPNVFIKLG